MQHQNSSFPKISIGTWMFLLFSGSAVDSFTLSSTPRPFAGNLHTPVCTSHHTSSIIGGTRRHLAVTIDHPISSSSNSFEKRMRKLALQRQRTTSTTISPTKQAIKPSLVQKVHTLEEYKDAVGDEREKVVVVRFYATWCAACRAVQPSFYGLAKEYKNEMKFIEVPITDENVALHQGLQVPSIPFAHIYHPQGGLVEELPLKRKQFPVFKSVLRSYANRQCELPDAVDCSNPYMDEN